MEGRYSCLLDGSWGNASQSAFVRYTAAEFEGMKPINAHAAYLTSQTFNRWLDEGWAYKHISYLDYSLMLPLDNLRLEEKNGLFEKWHLLSTDLLSYSTILTTTA
ncbi:hypothetical protein [Roseovarius sp. Pro17]|uniref:hypothetical protein n=1 Tax=Roseovarius sp. Pro17 TaxID=3108175 RepID=UPI002D76AA03|nr:hypothetical protein [Roseovarius sp. Pro17]